MTRSAFPWKYLGAGALLLGVYAAKDISGWEFAGAERTRMDPSVRQSPGGWRAWTFWHSGPRGGK